MISNILNAFTIQSLQKTKPAYNDTCSLKGQAQPARQGSSMTFCADGRPLPGVPPVVTDMSIKLPAGSRCILVGPNGAGKTTLLKILGGKHMVPAASVDVLGRSPFHDTELTSSGALSYLGGNWVRDIAFAGYSIPLQVGPASQHL